MLDDKQELENFIKEVIQRTVQPSTVKSNIIFDGVLSSNNNSITIPIPGEFRSIEALLLLRSTRPTVAADDIAVRFNGDSGTNYDGEYVRMLGTFDSVNGFPDLDGILEVSTTRARLGEVACSGSSTSTDTFTAIEILIPDYISNKYKTMFSRCTFNGDAQMPGLILSSYTWKSVNSITSMEIYSTSSNNLVTGSTCVVRGT